MRYQTLEFIHDLRWKDVPIPVQSMVRRCLLDLLGVAASGTQTKLSNIIRRHALRQFGAAESSARILFDGRACSPTGSALAGAMTIDSIDAHDGHKECKGHAGCGVLPALLAFCDAEFGTAISEAEFLCCLLIGYEVAIRSGISLHASACDYHTSGAWVSIAVAAMGARLLKLTPEETREAIGIAEFHGPRSQMMRCIDHPSMIKDGSGWGAMAGVSAAYLAQDGFTGAPAITVESADLAHIWNDLGEVWRIEEQYFKPMPVCRWTQPAVVATLALRQQHAIQADQIQSIRIGTFHESAMLATACPTTTEQAQYSLPFPVAAALIRGQLTVQEIEGSGLQQTDVLSLSQSIEIYEVDAFNEAFPLKRFSQVTIVLKDGQILESGPTEAIGDSDAPLSDQEIDDKFIQYAEPVLGEERTRELQDVVHSMGDGESIERLALLIYSAGR